MAVNILVPVSLYTCTRISLECLPISETDGLKGCGILLFALFSPHLDEGGLRNTDLEFWSL